MKFSAVNTTTLLELALIAGAVAVGVYVLRKSVSSVADGAAGLATGRNSITESARTTAYYDQGVLGTLGAATDNMVGGGYSRAGEWIGSTIYDLFNPSQDSTLQAGSSGQKPLVTAAGQ